MYAIFKTGGKQYKVKVDDKIYIEKLDVEEKQIISLGNVLFVGTDKEYTVGKPIIKDAVVKAEVLQQTRNKKIIVFKKNRRKNYRNKRGHRQHVTVLKVTDIVVPNTKS